MAPPANVRQSGRAAKGHPAKSPVATPSTGPDPRHPRASQESPRQVPGRSPPGQSPRLPGQPRLPNNKLPIRTILPPSAIAIG